jgi:hypothetical protein
VKEPLLKVTLAQHSATGLVQVSMDRAAVWQTITLFSLTSLFAL